MQQAESAAVAYYRVSTAKQGKSGLGIDAQREAVASYVASGGWRIAAEFTEIESGRRCDRPELDAALRAARARRCPLIVAKVDRLTRSVAFLSRPLETGVDVRFAHLPQLEGATGKFMLTQMVAVAELEAGFIATRTKLALARSHKKLGGRRRHVVAITADGERRYGDYVTISSEARLIGCEVRRRRASSGPQTLRH